MKNKVVVIVVVIVLLLCVCLYVMYRNCVFGSFCTSEEETLSHQLILFIKKLKIIIMIIKKN